MTIGCNDAIAGAGLLAGIVSLGANWRQRRVRNRESERLRMEAERGHRECMEQICRLNENLEESERNAQASAELLHDGRLSTTTRSRALRMLRSGMSPETAAAELGIARNEVRLLQKVAAVLVPRA